MDHSTLSALQNVLKVVGIGAGSGGVVFVIYIVWLHMTVMRTKEVTVKHREEIDEHRDCIRSHGVVLAKLETNQNNMDKKLDGISSDVSKLVDFHLNGRGKKV